MIEGFKDRDAGKLRSKFICPNIFSESWIPAINSGGCRRFQLFDTEVDSGQTSDTYGNRPRVFERLKNELHRINRSVISDAPDWN